MNKTFSSFLACVIMSILITPSTAHSSTAISGGFWFNYRYVDDDPRDDETSGDIGDEALIIYVDDKPEGRPWSFSSETRFGPGSFTDPINNSTGDNFAVHKAWVGYAYDENSQLKIGKSQVPFGWKTVNFWPGDMLLGGYGDQMDVGIKYSRHSGALSYELAYFHADDWGETSTDTLDDNRHWGSSTSYRKVKTLVANVDVELASNHTLGLSLQSGRLQDLTTTPFNTDNTHSAYNLHYHGVFGDFYTKAQYIDVVREIPNIVEDIENWRAALEFGYTLNDWFYFIDASSADTHTEGNSAKRVSSYAVGLQYDYGPGWIYLEYLNQDGFIDDNGDIGEGDFSAVYATIDYYF